MFKLTGYLKTKGETVQVSEKFAKREFSVEDASSMYPQIIGFQLAQDKCSILDGFNEQDQIEVSFNLRGREWTSPQGEVKVFNTLDAWRIELVSAAGTPLVPQNAAPATSTASPEIPADADEDGDLPF